MHRLIGRYRQAIAILAYAASASAAFALGFAVYLHSLDSVAGALVPLAALVAIRLVVHRLYCLTTRRWRFVGTGDVLRLTASTTTGSAIFGLVNVSGVLHPFVPWSVLALEWVLSIFLTCAGWIAYRTLFERFRVKGDGPGGHARRTLIIGAGEAGNLLAREIHRAPTGLHVVGFLDDDPLKAGTHVQGVRVTGVVADLERLAERLDVECVVIAIPTAEPAELRRIVDACERAGIEYKVLPGIGEALRTGSALRHLRKVTIEDLLGRAPVSVELPELAAEIDRAVVMVTGAGGSIGSELARQIAANHPRELLLVDQAESDLFFVELGIRERHPTLPVRAVVADVCDRRRMDELVRSGGVTHVYHAAAYKHVPLMEENPSEAVRNNVHGTRTLLEAAGAGRVRSFVLISTDKAVRPSSVMGRTKRVCELLLLASARRHPATRHTAVRFGNVLGSSGSVVQVFRRQLEAGTLTVTHPDITRYFMTVGEAVQLVLLASVMDEARGRIAMLEMGEPVRILDLARNMIRLSGLVEGRDVRIRFTGLRRGEKLHEELVAPSESRASTRNGKIQIVTTRQPSAELLWGACDRLVEVAGRGLDDDVRAALQHLTDLPEQPEEAPALEPVGAVPNGRHRRRAIGEAGAELPRALP